MAKKVQRVKTKLRVGDTVQLICGDIASGAKRRIPAGGDAKDLQPRGKIVSIDFEKGRAVVQGVNMVYRHKKRTDPNNPDSGGRFQHEAPIALSNLMFVDPEKNAVTRLGYKPVERVVNDVKKVKRVRVSKLSGTEFPGGKK